MVHRLPFAQLMAASGRWRGVEFFFSMTSASTVSGALRSGEQGHSGWAAGGGVQNVRRRVGAGQQRGSPTAAHWMLAAAL